MPAKATVTDEAIGGEVPRLLGAKGAAPDPEGESVEEEDAFQSCRHGRPPFGSKVVI